MQLAGRILKDPVFQKRLKDLYQEIEDTIRYRNKLAHAHWYIEHRMDKETFRVKKPAIVAKSHSIKRNKGVVNNITNCDLEVINELNGHVKENSRLTYRVVTIIYEIKK